MRIVRFKMNDTIAVGVMPKDSNSIYYGFEQNGQEVTCINDLITNYATFQLEDLNGYTKCALKDVELLAPVQPSKNVLCIGKNYVDHIKEFDGTDEGIQAVRENPIFFTKAVSSINNPYGNIPEHKGITAQLDYEVELAVVIGKKGVNISKEEALDYICGYAVLNDGTARDIQKRHQQWFRGKSLDGTCPIGPWIVTKDEIENPNALGIRSYVNGEIRQNANTDLMIHDVKQLIAILSQGMTLEPGDVIATGTPKGVGMGFKPPKLLKAGDVVKCEIEGIGYIENKIG